MSLLDTLKLGTDNHKLIKWPGTSQDVVVRILSEHDRMEATIATERLLKGEKLESSLTTADQYDTERCIQILYRALRDPSNLETPVANNITEFRKGITREDMKMLISEYTTYEQDCSPSPDNLTEEEFDHLLLEVKKNPGTLSGSSLSSSTLKRLITTLASRPQELPQANG